MPIAPHFQDTMFISMQCFLENMDSNFLHSTVFYHGREIEITVFLSHPPTTNYLPPSLLDDPPPQIYEPFLAKKTIILYVILNLVGLEIAYSLAQQAGNLNLMLIYPVAVFLLYLYSKTFKGIPLQLLTGKQHSKDDS